MTEPTSRGLSPEAAKDPWLWRFVVGGLALIGLITVLGALVLAGLGKEVPNAVITLGTTAIVGLVGLLAPSPVI